MEQSPPRRSRDQQAPTTCYEVSSVRLEEVCPSTLRYYYLIISHCYFMAVHDPEILSAYLAGAYALTWSLLPCTN